MQSNDPYEDAIDQLILDGLVEVAAMDLETGEMLYSFTEKAKAEIPEMQKEAEEYFDKLIMYFWENGFVSMNIQEKNPVISLTQKAFDEQEVSKLSSDLRQALNIIKDALRID